MSNLLLWASILGGGSILISLLKKVLNKVTSKMSIPKKYEQKKYRSYLIKILHKLNQLISQIEDSTLWNFLLMFILSIYQPGFLWSLLNMKYASALLEPSTTSTQASLALGIMFFLFFLTLLGLVSSVLLKNMKFLIQSGGISPNPQQQERLKKYDVLIEDFHRKKRLQILFLPISLLKSFVFVAVLALMAFSPMAQIVVIWGLSTAFVLYLVISQPLKVRWMRIMTLLIELLTYGCVTLAFVFGLIERFADVDPRTSNEMGFVFLILTIASTLAGGLLSLIQILFVIKGIYQYLKDRRANQNRVHPITLTEPQIISICSTPIRGKLIEESTDRSSAALWNNSPPSAQIEDLSKYNDMFAGLKNLSLGSFEKGTRKKQLLEDLKEWWDSYSSTVNIDADDLNQKTPGENTKCSADNLVQRVKRADHRQAKKISQKDKA